MSTIAASEKWEAVGHVVRTARGEDGHGGFEVAAVSLHRPDPSRDAKRLASALSALAACEAVAEWVAEYGTPAGFPIDAVLAAIEESEP
jgi:hypothetical protein